MSTYDFGVVDYLKYIAQVDTIIQSSSSKHISGLNRILEAHGKRYRPGIVLAITFHSGKKIDESVIKAASAIELIHLATLIHDDIMDEGLVRHGLPTINSQEGPDQAILAGDYLIAKGLVLASQVSSTVAEILAQTVTELCNGQAMEINDRFNTERTEISLLNAIKGKTCSMFVAAVKIGGILAQLDPKQISILSSFADNFGVAYQYFDDVTDFVVPGSADKSLGNDLREGNYTLPIILSLQGSRQGELIKLLNNNPNSSKILEILNADGSIQKTQEIADSYKQKAIDDLSNLESRKIANMLTSFVNKL